ncbi:hypothetical protein ES703_105647 [subsurface metagenome]
MKKELNDDEKNLTDVLLSLQTHAFNSVKNRQGFEWRLSISLWTAFVILLGFLLKGDVPELTVWMKLGVTCVATVIVVLHLFWVKGAGRRTRADIHVEYFWEKQVRQLLDTNYTDSLQKELDALQSTSGYIRTYSFFVQLSTTFFLALAIICAVWCR